MGGQRRRGKGRCECTAKILDPGSNSELSALQGLVLPATDASRDAQFRSFAQPMLMQAKSMKLNAAAELSSVEDIALVESSTDPSQRVAESKPACWLVFAVADSPLTLGHDQAVDNTIYSEDFISGASLRGALAWQAIRSGMNPDSALFQDVFVRERVQFGPLFPAASDWSIAGSMPSPIPASFCTCKRFPGAKGNVTTQVHRLFRTSQHGVADRMWHSGEKCDYCEAATKSADGYLQLTGDSRAAEIQLGRPAMHVFQRTAIDEKTQRGADSQLFGLESVQQGARLAGYLWGEQDLLEQAFGNGRECWTKIRVGKAKSRGQGVVQIWLQQAASGEHACFPNLLPGSASSTAGDEATAAGVNETDQPFCFTLYSDFIAVDDYLRPVTALTDDSLWRLLSQTGSPPFELDKGFVNTRRIGGFLGVVGLPRSADIAIAAGSTWRFRWRDGTDEKSRKDAWTLLTCAQARGIGLRRGEGFGRFILNHPLHLALWDNTQLPSRPITVSTTAFPEPESVTRATADRSRQWTLSQAAPSEFGNEYQRLFAELAQEENPLLAVQKLFDDPLHRTGKAKNLAGELKKLAGEKVKLFEERHGQSVCIAKESANDPALVSAFRGQLKKYCGEILDHV